MDLLCEPSPSEPAVTPATIGILPDDVLAIILARLADKVDADGRDRQKELLPLERVCKRWRPFVLDVAWEIVVIRSPDGQPPNVRTYLSAFASLLRMREAALILAFVFPEDDLLPTICTAQHAENLKSLTFVPIVRDASSLSRLLEYLAKLHNLVGLGLNLKAGDLSSWTRSSVTIERPLPLRSLVLHMVSAGGGGPGSSANALRALRSIIDPDALDVVKISNWTGDAATMDTLAEFPNLRLLDVALRVPAPNIAQGLRAMRNLASLRGVDLHHSLDQSELVVKSPFSLRDFLASLPPNLEGVGSLACRVFAFPADEAEAIQVLEVATEGTLILVLVHISVYEDETKLARQEIKTKYITSTTSLRSPTWRRIPI
ncbi:hypothetical protein RHOSPDRAFT_32494 [Rhodotorula sp. JG-1b]|nr:hypothetical protein RHOSPDRAFT_32494 [Rhodotorula sp. JG-1b]